MRFLQTLAFFDQLLNFVISIIKHDYLLIVKNMDNSTQYNAEIHIQSDNLLQIRNKEDCRLSVR